MSYIEADTDAEIDAILDADAHDHAQANAVEMRRRIRALGYDPDVTGVWPYPGETYGRLTRNARKPEHWIRHRLSAERHVERDGEDIRVMPGGVIEVDDELRARLSRTLTRPGRGDVQMPAEKTRDELSTRAKQTLDERYPQRVVATPR